MRSVLQREHAELDGVVLGVVGEHEAQALDELLHPHGVAVVTEAYHLCMMMRGVQKQNSSTVASCLLGDFRDDSRTRQEFLNLVAAADRHHP